MGKFQWCATAHASGDGRMCCRLAGHTGEHGDWQHPIAETPVHHVDCDGHRYAHRATVRRDGTMFRAVADGCCDWRGSLFGRSSERDAQRECDRHFQEVVCDGRCREWDAVPCS